jgi:hypothetical protein
MSILTVVLFASCSLYLLANAIQLIRKAAALPAQKFEEPIPPEVVRRKVTRPVHPEMKDVRPGDELLVVNFKKNQVRDPWLDSLQDRVDQLNDDDGDGDVPVLR